MLARERPTCRTHLDQSPRGVPAREKYPIFTDSARLQCTGDSWFAAMGDAQCTPPCPWFERARLSARELGGSRKMRVAMAAVVVSGGRWCEHIRPLGDEGSLHAVERSPNLSGHTDLWYEGHTVDN